MWSRYGWNVEAGLEFGFALRLCQVWLECEKCVDVLLLNPNQNLPEARQRRLLDSMQAAADKSSETRGNDS